MGASEDHSRARAGPAEGLSLRARLGDASNVLLYGSHASSHDHALCARLLSLRDPAIQNVVCFDFSQSVDERLTRYARTVDDPPANMLVVRVGGRSRSTGRHGGSGPSYDHDEAGAVPVVETVSDPADLTGMGIALNRALETWSPTANQTVLCFHTLTMLLQYVDTERVYRFLHVITSQLAEADALAHVHLDPHAHDPRTLSTLSTLFDAVIRLDENGDLSVDPR